MHYDKLWYNYHSIGTYKLLFNVYVKAYDMVEEEKDGVTRRKLVEGGEITLSNHKKSGHGVHGRVRLHFILIFKPENKWPDTVIVRDKNDNLHYIVRRYATL